MSTLSHVVGLRDEQANLGKHQMVQQTGQPNWFSIHHKLIQGDPNPNHHIGPRDIVQGTPTFNVVNEVTTEWSEFERCSSIPNNDIVV